MKLLVLIALLTACSGPGFSLDHSSDGGITYYDSTTNNPPPIQSGDTGGDNSMGSGMDGRVGGSGGSPSANGAAPASGGSPDIDTAFVRPIADKIVPGTGPDWTQDLSEPCDGEPMADGDRYTLSISMEPAPGSYLFEDSPTWLLCNSVFDCFAKCFNSCTADRVLLATAEYLKTNLVIWGEDLDGVKLFSISFKPFNLDCPARFIDPLEQALTFDFIKR